MPRVIHSSAHPNLAVTIEGESYEFRYCGVSIETWRIAPTGAIKVDASDRHDFPSAVGRHVTNWIKAEQTRIARAAASIDRAS